MTDRRKIQYYIFPEKMEADAYVDSVLESIPQGDRGRILRAATLAGFALHKVESRIPYLLAELLNAKTSKGEILQILKAVIPDDMESIIPEPKAKNSQQPEMPTGLEKKTDTEEETRLNAKGLFPH